MEAKDKKNHILETAEELFARKGFEAATVRDIADAANVNLAMISYYFGSKDKLMESLFHERMDAMKMKVEALLNDDSLTPFEKVESVLEGYVKKVIEKQSFYKILLCEQVTKKSPAIVKLVRELKMNYAGLFTEIVKQGQRKKIFKKNVDVVLALSTMTGTVTQMMLNKEYYADFYQHNDLSEAEYSALLYKKILTHLKSLFKTILGYES